MVLRDPRGHNGDGFVVEQLGVEEDLVDTLHHLPKPDRHLLSLQFIHILHEFLENQLHVATVYLSLNDFLAQSPEVEEEQEEIFLGIVHQIALLNRSFHEVILVRFKQTPLVHFKLLQQNSSEKHQFVWGFPLNLDLTDAIVDFDVDSLLAETDVQKDVLMIRVELHLVAINRNQLIFEIHAEVLVSHDRLPLLVLQELRLDVDLGVFLDLDFDLRLDHVEMLHFVHVFTAKMSPQQEAEVESQTLRKLVQLELVPLEVVDDDLPHFEVPEFLGETQLTQRVFQFQDLFRVQLEILHQKVQVLVQSLEEIGVWKEAKHSVDVSHTVLDDFHHFRKAARFLPYAYDFLFH